MPEKDKQLNALLELERRSMAGDPEITAEVKEKIDSKLKAYRDQGLAKPLGGDDKLSETARSRLEADIGIYAGLKGSYGGFQKDYAGNTVTGDLENLAQSLNSDIGTPGQRDWWASFKRMDNQVRNELFGATLTPSEQAAYEATTISPRMDPKEVKANLRTRAEIVRKALSRRTDYFKTSGYNPKSVDALAGEYAPDFAAGFTLPEIVDEEGEVRPSNTTLVMADEAPRDLIAKLPPEKEAEFLKIAPYMSPETMVKWFKDNKFDIPPEQAQKAYDYYQQGGKEAAGIDYSQAEEREKEEARKRLKASDRPAELQATDEGVRDIFSFGFGDEARALGRTVMDGGTYSSNLTDTRAEQDVLAEDYPVGTIASKFAAGLALPFGTGARTPIQLAKSGGAMGAAYGFGSGEDPEGRIIGGALGGATGAGLGYGIGKIAQRFTSPGSPRGPGPGKDVAEAAADIGMEILPADVGGQKTQTVTDWARRTPFGQRINDIATRGVERAREFRDETATSVGQVLEPEAAGERAAKGAKDYISQSSQRGGQLFDRAESLAEGATVSPQKAIAELDRSITELSDTPGGAEGLAALKSLRDDLAKGSFTVAGVRRMRSVLGQRYLDGGLTMTDTQRRVNKVIDAAADDITDSLRAAGKDEAADAYKAANDFWRDRMAKIENFIEPIIGKDGSKSGEQVMKAIDTAAKSNGRRVQGFMETLDQDSANAVKASIITRLGSASAGRQNVEGTEFSLQTLMTQWNQITPRAKAVFFDRPTREALNKLLTVAEGAKATQKFANTSNSGGNISTGIAVVSGGGIIPAFVAGGPLAALAAASPVATQFITARMMASPRFLNWLLNAPERTGARRAWIGKLPKIASQNPAIANDIATFERQLLTAMNDNAPRSVAASEGQQEQR